MILIHVYDDMEPTQHDTFDRAVEWLLATECQGYRFTLACLDDGSEPETTDMRSDVEEWCQAAREEEEHYRHCRRLAVGL